MQGIPLAATAISSGAQNNMQKGQGPLQAYADPADIFGGNSAQAMDPIGYGVFNALGAKNLDPLVMATNKIPGFQGSNPNANAGGVFPNLGAQSLIPMMPGGAFQNIHNGTGAYNNMAATGAGGQMFNPSIGAPQSSGGSKPQQTAPNAHLMNGPGGNSLRIKP